MTTTNQTLDLANCTPAQIAAIARSVVAADERRRAKLGR
jgi:hypothetical protein